MNRLRSSTRAGLLRHLARDVPLERVRHNDRPVYVAEGYGGRPIEHFPPYGFFRLFAAGEGEEAFARFCAWYGEQFRRYAGVSKQVGGMQGGTLHRLLAEVCREAGTALPADPLAADPALLEEAIGRRVRQRFDLLESIRSEGYRAERGKPVLAVRRGEDAVLLGGHHRAAVQSVLGSEVLPGVSVFQPTAFRALKRLAVV
jgi:hypothetical protein